MMGDAQLDIPPSATTFPPASTPSGLTPNTRSEAEAALRRNSLVQTDSAAPLLGGGGNTLNTGQKHADEAQRAYRMGPVRQSSTNYEEALNAWKQQNSVSSNFSHTSHEETNRDPSVTGERTVASPTGTVPFPKPGEGVVPLHNGVDNGAALARAGSLNKTRPSGLSLGSLGRQQSWSEQDLRHAMSTQYMERREDGGYDSGVDGKVK